MKIFKYIVSALIAVSFAACTDFLLVEPESDFTASSYWKTASDANSGVQSIYSAFSIALANRLWDWGDFKSDEFYFINPQNAIDQMALVDNTVRYDNQTCKWSGLYQTIGRANAAIKYIPRITMSITDQNRLLASAYTLRAWSYFYLVRVWGDVPLTLTPFEAPSDSIFMRRTKKESIHKVIVSDLLKADSLFGQSTYAEKKYVTRALVYALEMDVYAWLHQYDKVQSVMETKMTPFIGSVKKFGLGFTKKPSTQTEFNTLWKAPFNEAQDVNQVTEVIFKMAYAKAENGTNYSKYYFSNNGSSNIAYYTQSFVSSYSTVVPNNDYRLAAQGNKDSNGNYLVMNNKLFSSADAYATLQDNDLVLYRFADVQLLYAEALCMQNKLAAAVAELNKTRVRSNLTAITFTNQTQATIQDAILLERKLELAGEGKRWFDLVRNNKYERKGDSKDDINTTFSPIYRDDILRNANLLLPAID